MMTPSGELNNRWAALPLNGASGDQVLAILRTERDRISRPWSIAELRLSNGDIEWLLSWFRNLSADLPSPVVLGGLLVTLAAELCRNHSPEDAIWPTIRQIIPDNHPCQREMFLLSGDPTRLTREAIGQAVQVLDLRHAMDLEGTQQWYETIKLQFGFTCRGARRRLAEWLVGLGAPASVRYLNGEIETEKKLGSDSFRSLWLAMRQYRSGVRSEAEVRLQLEGSPWIRPAWIDDLLKEAKSRIQTLGSGDGAVRGSAAQEVPETTEAFPFVKAVLMHWEVGQQPCLQLELDKENIEEYFGKRLDITELDVFVDGQRFARWVKQADGSFHGEATISISKGASRSGPNLSPRSVILRTESGDVVDATDLADLGLAADVLVFDLRDGKLLDAGMQRLKPAHPHAVICDRDSRIEGCNPTETYESPAGRKKAYYLPAPLPGDLRISYDDFVLWQPVQPLAQAESFAVRLGAEDDKIVSLGQPIRLRIEGPF